MKKDSNSFLFPFGVDLYACNLLRLYCLQKQKSGYHGSINEWQIHHIKASKVILA
ncbi:hypothetical protein [Thermodesulfatator autotrophicus]|uniref:hypothetical protein n=1 Tax=Thermodesulfatator autotrophicus TaxID=1795632 RepID=UPI0012F71936|nr:hypothetical protein [Thermodesulfatator autotrophicus]